MREYISGIGKPQSEQLRDCYSELCNVTHPGAIRCFICFSTMYVATELKRILAMIEPDQKPEFLQLQWADPCLTEEQMKELDRRLEEHRKNPNEAIPWEVVKENLRQRHGN